MLKLDSVANLIFEMHRSIANSNVTISTLKVNQSQMASEVESYSAKFLKHLSLILSIGHVKAEITSELYYGHYQVMFGVAREEKLVIIRLGVRIIGFVNLSDKSYWHVSIKENADNSLKLFGRLFLDLLSRPIDDLYVKNRGDRCLIVADDRPSHFIRQAVGGIYKLSAELNIFIKGGGQVFYLKDKCLVNPAVAFSKELSHYFTKEESLNFYLSSATESKFVHRLYRTSLEDVEWIRKCLRSNVPNKMINSVKYKKINIIISLEVEKSRWANQSAAVVSLLKKIKKVSKILDVETDVYIDCWTFSDFENFDDVICKKILYNANHLIDVLEKLSGLSLKRVYDKKFSEKIDFIKFFDLAIVPHGTAALIPCKILNIPTVTFGSSQQFLHHEDIEVKNWYPVDPKFICEDIGNSHLNFTQHKYEVSALGIIKRLVSILRERHCELPH